MLNYMLMTYPSTSLYFLVNSADSVTHKNLSEKFLRGFNISINY